MILIYVILFLFVCYSSLIIYYWLAWKSIPDYVPAILESTLKISVIVPARNEEKNIDNLLIALQDQTYPASLFEVIVVDDHSTDSTSDIVQQYSFVKLIQLKDDNI